MYQSIITEVDDTIGLLTLNKPERHNALDETLVGELSSALLALEADPRVRVVVLSATGKIFCAGNDVAWTRRSAANGAQDKQHDEDLLGHLMLTLNNLSKPTLARVQGAALGSGVGLVAACDIAVANYDCQFALTEVRFDAVPAMICPFILAAIGERHARRYLLTTERFSAAEAYRIGLVHELCVPAELDATVNALLGHLVQGGPAALGESKRLIRDVAGRAIDDALAADAAAGR